MAGRMRARVLARPTARGGAFRLAALGATAALLAAMLPALVASADAAAPAGAACDHRSNNTYPKLLECVTLEGVREHQAAFQEIADDSTDPVYPGTRAAGTDGYADSVDYVAGLLEDAGYEVTLDPVDITFNFPAVLRQLTPVEAEYETGVFTGSGSGYGRGPGHPGRHQPDAGDRASTSGCEPADFAGIDWSGDADIALVQRGTCFFGTKAFYAEQAGAEAVIIFNQGNTPDREGLIVADATSVDPPIPGAPGPVTHGIPVVGASFADGVGPGPAGFDRLRRGAAGGDPHGLQRHRGAARQERGQRRDGRCPPRQRDRGPGHQRQRLRLGGTPRDRPDDGQPQPAEHPAVRLVGRRGAGSGRLGRLRRRVSRRRSATGSRCT